MFSGKSGLSKKTNQFEELNYFRQNNDISENVLNSRIHQLAKDERLNQVINEANNFENQARDNLPDSDEDNQASKNIRDELKETKSKLKVMVTKFSNLKKEKETLQKENKQLQEEVMSLQSSLRQMIPGFANTGSSFPMLNELVNSISEFYKYGCEDIFFDLLCPELNMKGIILFFSTAFQQMIETVQNYFLPSEMLIKETICVASLEGPIMNVLRKSSQSTWKSIQKQCFPQTVFNSIVNEIQSHLKLGACSQETNNQIISFLQKMSELVLCFYISDPPLVANYKQIGAKVTYNPLKHEPFDGFIKNKDECIVVLPAIHKGSLEGEVMTKSLVLQVNYEIPN